MSLILTDATLVDARGARAHAWVHVAGDTIRATGVGDPPTVPGAAVIDAAGGFVTPGFIDIHCHGGGGFAHDDGEESILRAVAAHRAHGTTRALVSLVSAPLPALESRLGAVAAAARRDGSILGAHLEGPFLGDARRGAHDPLALTDPTPRILERLLEAAEGTVRQITIDPLRPGAHDTIASARAAGVVVAVGHTDADLSAAGAAFDAGATLLTHAFNAMPGLHHRAPGPVLAAVQRPAVTLELIWDGVHVHPALAAALFDLAPHRVALVTDAMSAAAAAEGRYRLGSLDVDVRGGRARIAGTETLAGSVLTQHGALLGALAQGLPAHAAVEALTLTPARALGLQHRFGLLEPGRVADLLVLDAAWQLTRVVVGGRPEPSAPPPGP